MVWTLLPEPYSQIVKSIWLGLGKAILIFCFLFVVSEYIVRDPHHVRGIKIDIEKSLSQTIDIDMSLISSSHIHHRQFHSVQQLYKVKLLKTSSREIVQLGSLVLVVSANPPGFLFSPSFQFLARQANEKMIFQFKIWRPPHSMFEAILCLFWQKMKMKKWKMYPALFCIVFQVIALKIRNSKTQYCRVSVHSVQFCVYMLENCMVYSFFLLSIKQLRERCSHQ